MAGSKRLSAEEKRKTILGIYHKTKSVFTEKEVITLATKEGVNSNTIVDMNQALVDDGLVDKDKIGGSNYFWSFPAKKDHLDQKQHQETMKLIETLQVRVAEAQAQVSDAKRGREETVDQSSGGGGGGDTTRATKLARLGELAKQRLALSAELEKLQENDPAAVANLEKELKLVTEAANRWTDNMFNCKTYLTKKRAMDKKEANRVLCITDAFDYPEDKIPK